jgi:hypothetical protein
MIVWKYELERGFMGENVTFAVYCNTERAPLFRIDVGGFSDIDGSVQACFNKIELNKYNHLKVIGVDLI